MKAAGFPWFLIASLRTLSVSV